MDLPRDFSSGKICTTGNYHNLLHFDCNRQIAVLRTRFLIVYNSQPWVEMLVRETEKTNRRLFISWPSFLNRCRLITRLNAAPEYNTQVWFNKPDNIIVVSYSSLVSFDARTPSAKEQ